MEDKRINPEYLIEQENMYLQTIKEKHGADISKISDGYHTFDELYHHRAILFASLCNILANELKDIIQSRCWKSKKHHDGTMYDGMFIVGMDTKYGQITYHYDVDPYWDMFKVRELDKAPLFDGHTPKDAIDKMKTLFIDDKRTSVRNIMSGADVEYEDVY